MRRIPSLMPRTNGSYAALLPDSRKIELSEDATTDLKGYLLKAMVFDLASIHAAGSVGIGALQRDLERRPRGWLSRAAKTAAAAVEKDFEEWKNHKRRG